MGTVTNGKKWAGACVNGKVVSGLVKNGVVFYRKPVSTYKRRIMVGDNITGKTIYHTFTFSDWDNMMADKNKYIESEYGLLDYIVANKIDGNSNDIFVNYSFMGNGEYAGKKVIDVSTQFYHKDFFPPLNMNSETITLLQMIEQVGIIDTIIYPTIINDGNNRIVESIIDCYAYRKTFIEDENIRPLKVGDVITGNTKLYFTFPDNFRNELPNQWAPDIQDIIFLNENSTENTRRMSISYTSSNNNDCMIRYWYKKYNDISWGGNTNATIFDLAKKRNLSFSLAGNMNQLESVGFIGTVSTINTISPAYKYILVDTTTLGA